MTLTGDQRTILANEAFFSMYVSLTTSFLIPFALVLGASNVIVGVINALQYVAIALAQVPGQRAIEALGRRVVYFSLVPFGRLMWVVMLLLPFYLNSSLLVLMVFWFIINFIEYFAEPGFLSMVADAVPTRVRGFFFARKNIIKMFFQTVLFFAAGFYLDLFPKESVTGFANLLLAGIVFGLLGVVVFARISSPNAVPRRKHGFGDYFKLSPNFRRFLRFTVWFNFAAMIASPFFTVYMLENLGLSYSLFVTATVVSVAFRILAQHRLGALTDKVGDRAVAWMMTLGTATVPVAMFFVTPERLWLLWVVQALSGFVWGGSDLAVFNMLLDVTNRKERSFQVSAYVFFTALPLAVAPVLGGWLADNVVFIIGGIPLVFIISGALRALTSLFLLGVPELRAKRSYSMVSVFKRIIGIEPERGLDTQARHVNHVRR